MSAEILIVEDSPTQAEQLRFVLEKHGFVVFVSENGKVALEFLDRHLPNLILSDVMMPEMDGYQLCKAVKENAKLKHLPVMLLTALSDAQAVLDALECGADNFFTKPFDEKLLMQRINDLLQNLELQKTEKAEIEFVFSGQRHRISADMRQVLDLLLSSYEIAVDKNVDLLRTQDELRILNGTLEEKVWERTAKLVGAEEEARKTNRALRALSWVNEKLVHADNEREFLLDVCSAITGEAGYPLAWVGILHGDKIVPEVRTGSSSLYGENLIKTLSSVGSGRLPAETAVREGKSVIVSDIGREAPSAWRETAIESGFLSVAAFPLISGGKILGALCIDAAEADAFSAEEIKLLDQLANNLAYGIASLRSRSFAGERIEMKILTSLTYGIYGVDPAGRCIFANRAASEMLGFEGGETLKEESWVSAEESPASPVLLSKSGKIEVERVFKRRDGSSIAVFCAASPLWDDGRFAGAVVAFREISGGEFS